MIQTTLTAPTTPGGTAFAPAFADNATVHALTPGPGLTGEVRTDSEGTVHVLTVRNATDQVQDVLPEALLPQAPGPLLFLGGESTTDEDGGRIVARLKPHGFVQLGRITAPQEIA